MKRCIPCLIAILLFITGCSSSAYDTYVEAMEKTESTQRYQTLLEIEVDMTFDEDGLDEGELKALENFEHTELSFETTIDHGDNRSLTKVQGRVYGKGIQGKVYQEGEEIFVISPLLPKILVVQSQEFSAQTSYPGEKFSKETFQELQELWRKTLTRENVSTIGNMVISTPEGEIKAKEYHMDLKEEDMVPLLHESLDILLKDDFFKTMITQEVPEELDMEQELRRMVESTRIKELRNHAFIDRDHYIAEESFTMGLEFRDEDNILETMDILIHTQNWGFDQEVTMEFPEVHDGNIMHLQELLEEQKITIGQP